MHKICHGKNIYIMDIIPKCSMSNFTKNNKNKRKKPQLNKKGTIQEKTPD